MEYPLVFAGPEYHSMEEPMARSLILIAACALALVTLASAHAQDSPTSSPSLGDLARQAQKDKDKDKANKPAAKVFTNEDLPSNSGGVSAALGGGLGEVAPLSAGNKSGATPSPAEKLAMMETFLNQVDSLDRATLVRNVLNGKDVDFPGRAKWEERLFAAKQAYVTQAREMVQKARQIIASADSLKGNQDPNDPRVKEVNARLQSLIRDAVQTDSGLQAVMIEGRDLAALPAAH
jgi:hypothetical protein